MEPPCCESFNLHGKGWTHLVPHASKLSSLSGWDHLVPHAPKLLVGKQSHLVPPDQKPRVFMEWDDASSLQTLIFYRVGRSHLVPPAPKP